MAHKNSSFTINSTLAKSFNQQGCIYINTIVDWDSFPNVAEQLTQCIDATIENKDIGADLHRWQLDFEGVRLYLTYEETSGSLWLELDRKEDQETLDFIATLIEKTHD